MSKPDNDHFTMSEPEELGTHSKYAFWLTTTEDHLITFMGTLPCVCHVTDANEDEPRRVLVSIEDSFDADEAWHWIRTEMEQEVNVVHLDQIWEDAMKWL